MEIWKDINGYEGYYKVSSFGRVKRMPIKVLSRNKWNEYYRISKERICKFHINKSGYARFELSKDGKQKMFSGHRIVAMAFIDNPIEFAICMPQR